MEALRALAIDEEQLGDRHPDTAIDLNNLTELYRSQGKYEQAEPLYQRALVLLEEWLGGRHPTTLIVRSNYAGLLRDVGRAAEAEQVEAQGRGQEAEGT
jgi:tetratricopeptide (TPR) repeat protein